MPWAAVEARAPPFGSWCLCGPSPLPSPGRRVRDLDLRGRQVHVDPNQGECLPDPHAGRKHEQAEIRQVLSNRFLVGAQLREPGGPLVVSEGARFLFVCTSRGECSTDVAATWVFTTTGGASSM